MAVATKEWELPRNIIEYLFVIILVLDGNAMWTSYENTQLNRILKLALVAVVVLYVFVNKGVTRSDVNRIVLFGLFLAAYFIIYLLAVDYERRGFLYFVIDVLCIYIFVLIAQEHHRGVAILNKYVNVIVILAVISLIFWAFGSILGMIHPTGNVYSTWTGSRDLKKVPTYYNLYFEAQTLDWFSFDEVIRNTGIFTEAPMYSFHLCVALLVELFVKKPVPRWKSLILVITILTTFSTTGWILMILALVARYIVTRNITKFFRALKVIILPVVVVVGIILIQVLVIDKLGSSSGSIRVDDFAAGFKAWREYPLFGSGFGNDEFVKQFMSFFRSDNQGYSNAPMQILYQGGIFLFVPYVYVIVKGFYRNIKERSAMGILFCAAFLYLFIITVIPYNFLTILIFMLCAVKGENMLTERNAPNA